MKPLYKNKHIIIHTNSHTYTHREKSNAGRKCLIGFRFIDLFLIFHSFVHHSSTIHHHNHHSFIQLVHFVCVYLFMFFFVFFVLFLFGLNNHHLFSKLNFMFAVIEYFTNFIWFLFYFLHIFFFLTAINIYLIAKV